MDTSVFSAIAAMGSALAATAAYLLTRKLYKTSIKVHISNTHTAFQSQMRTIQGKFDHRVNTPNWIPSDEDKRNIRLYWYLVLDEFITCCHLDERTRPLWDNFYLHGVIAALKHEHFRKDVEELIKDSSLLGCSKAFKKMIEEAKGKTKM